MKSTSFPDAIVIGRIVVYTKNRFLAREVEELVEREELPKHASSGRVQLGADSIGWTALPCSVKTNTNYQTESPAVYD